MWILRGEFPAEGGGKDRGTQRRRSLCPRRYRIFESPYIGHRVVNDLDDSALDIQ
jgi:hypothetical protein